MSEAKQSMVDEKQFEFKEVFLSHCRVHSPQLVLCVVFPSRKILQYDDTYKFESQKLTNLMTMVYDVYQPDIATINCGYKTNNKDPHIHWLFDFSVKKFNSNLKDIAANTHSDKKNQLEKHIEHFNKQRLLFSNTFKLKNFIYNQNDIDLYKEMFPNIIPNNIPKNIIDSDQFRCEFNNNYCERSTSVFVVIPIQNNQSLTKKGVQIDDALQNLIRFTHNSRDSMISFIKGENKPMTHLHYQALQWFELSVKRQNQQIFVRSTVTIFHFMWIMLRNSFINNSDIPSWFGKYCDYVAENEKMLSKYNLFECDYQNHHELYLNINAKKLKRMRCIGRGSKNRRLDCTKIVHHGINQMQNNMSRTRISKPDIRKNDVKKCTDCGITRKGKVYAADGLFYCLQCWDKYENKDGAVDDEINQIQNSMSEMRISGKEPMHWTEKHRINHVNKCTDCSRIIKGKVYDDGLFYCLKCWNEYDENKDTESEYEYEY